MNVPTLFIGSSMEGLPIAQAVRKNLNKNQCVKADIWQEGVFNTGHSFLEDLLKSCEKYDLAAIVFTPDEKVTSRGKRALSPRDNLLFEAGLFMGKIGRERTFILTSRDLKTPTDLEGITLVRYDYALAKDNPASAMQQACQRIAEAVDQLNFRHLTGTWKSRYRYPYKDDHPLIKEEVEILASFEQMKIVSLLNPKADYYVAFGRRTMNYHFVGHWESTDKAGVPLRSGGAFVLTIHPMNKILYGFFVSPDRRGGVTHGSWVLVKNTEGTARQLDSLFAEGIMLLDEANKQCQLNLGPCDPPVPRRQTQKSAR